MLLIAPGEPRGRPLSSLVPSPPFPGRSWDSLSPPVVVLGTPAHGMCWLHLPWDTAWPSPIKPEQGFLGTQALDSRFESRVAALRLLLWTSQVSCYPKPSL